MLPGLVAATDPPSGDRGKQIGPLGRAILADRIGVEGGDVGILDRRCIAVAPVPTIGNADAGRDGAEAVRHDTGLQVAAADGQVRANNAQQVQAVLAEKHGHNAPEMMQRLLKEARILLVQS